MTDARGEAPHPFGAFTVERLRKDDGRWIHYYSWPDETAPEPGPAGTAAAPRQHDERGADDKGATGSDV
jgi:hypothetical protein